MKKFHRRKRSKPTSTSLASSLQFLKEEEPPLPVEFSTASSCIATTTNHPGFKGVRFSPDGTCVLTSDGKQCQIYEPDCAGAQAAVSITEGEPIYNYSWFPAMDSMRPETCCFATVCKNTPVHLWDAYESNKLRASYQLVTKEMEPIWALCVELTTTNVYAGLDHWIYSWDLTRPGAPTERMKTRRRGMVCAMDFNAKWSCFGTYSGYVLASNSTGGNQQVEWEQMVFPCGVSQVKFLPQCDYQVMIAGRRAREIVCLDLRNCTIVQRIPRTSINNQRLEFDLLGDLLAFGNGDNVLEVWRGGGMHKVGEAFASGVINGVSFNRTNCELAIATGTRPRTNLKLDDDEEEEEEEKHTPSELLLWKYIQ